MFIFHCNDWRFKMFSNLEYSLFPYSYFFVFFPNAFVVCTQISVSRKLNRSTWSIWSLACSQALVWAKESAVQSGPTHNSLCLASLLRCSLWKFRYDVWSYKIFTAPIDGHWGRWSDWGSCSKTCNDGIRKRFRRCDNPSPTHGGKDCQGYERGQEMCILKRCHLGKWEMLDTEFIT